MRIIRTQNTKELSARAADMILAQVILKPDSVLGLATGGSPVGTYEKIVESYQRGEVDFSQVTSINPDEEEACAQYDRIIAQAGTIDLQLLGIGLDGHIGFNEPGDYFECNTHCVNLTESTIEANRRFFNSREEVPRQAYTMGIRPILQAKRVLMIASGKNKAEILHKAFIGPVTPQIPASILQLHPDFTLIADAEALSEL